MAKEPSPTKFKQAILGYRGVVLRVFVMLLLSFVGIVIYKRFDPFALPGIEQRALFALIPLGLITLALYFPYSWAASKLKNLLPRWASSALESAFSLVESRLGSLGARIAISRSVRKAASAVFLALLVLLVLQVVYDWSFLQNYQTPLIIVTIAFGALALWLNVDKAELKAEIEQEELEETKRRGEFGEKFLGVNRIPVVRWFIKWMYKEGWIYSIGLTLLVLVGFGLKLWNLGKLGIWWDEGIVYMSGKSILETKLPYLESGLLYLRDLPHLYTTALSLLVFGENEFALRLPSVLFGVALIVVIYWLSKEILKNKNIALLASTCVAFHYWFLEFSRWGRSYIMVALLVSLSILFFYKGLIGNSRKYMLLFALTAIVSVMTHLTGQIVLLLFLLIPFFSKGKLKNVFQLRYVLTFFTALSGIVLYRFLFSLGHYPHAFQQQVGQPTSIWEGLIDQIPFASPNIHNLEIFYVIIVFCIFATISILTSACFILCRPNNYPTGLKYLNYVFLIFLLAILFSETPLTRNREIFFIFPLVTVLFCTILTGLIKLITRRRIYPIVILLLAAILLVSSIQIPLRDYGDSIAAKYAPSQVIDFYPDNKTPAMMLNNLYTEGDIVLYYVDVISSWPYFISYKPTYKVTKERADRISGYWLSGGTVVRRDVGTNTWLITSEEELRSVLESKNRIWAITAYSILSYNEDYPGLYHIRPGLWKLLYDYGFSEIYKSKDNASMLLFKDNTVE